MANYNQVGYGSSGSDVTELQKLLNQNGHSLDVDGQFGPKTLAAVKKYQQENGLSVDGIVGKNTWGSLTKAQTTGGTGSSVASKPSAADMKFEDKGHEESDVVKQAAAMLQQHMAKEPGEYTSPWQTQLNDVINKILNREKFSYDLNGDALYQQYKDQHTTQGKMAMMDTMGQAAAMTGGYGNSYAQSVGQQAYQGYLQQLNDKIPELYQLALSQYQAEGDAMYNQAALMAQQEEQAYGRHRDQVSDYFAELDRLQSQYNAERDYDYGKYIDDRNFSYGKFTDDRNLAYQQERDKVSDQQWQARFDEDVRQHNASIAQQAANLAFQREKAEIEQANWEKEFDLAVEKAAADSKTLWNPTGTYDAKNNPIFINSEGKTQAFGPGINPYTGTDHKDAENGTFSNGYQPNNINGTPLTNSGMSTNITGKSQTIWQANGKYWLWRGDLNKYIEVDVSDMD